MITTQPSGTERLEARLLCRAFLPPDSYDSLEATYAAPLDYNADGHPDLADHSCQGA